MLEPVVFDIQAWITAGIRQLEDMLVVHAAFQAYLEDR